MTDAPISMRIDPDYIHFTEVSASIHIEGKKTHWKFRRLSANEWEVNWRPECTEHVGWFDADDLGHDVNALEKEYQRVRHGCAGKD